MASLALARASAARRGVLLEGMSVAWMAAEAVLGRSYPLVVWSSAGSTTRRLNEAEVRSIPDPMKGRGRPR